MKDFVARVHLNTAVADRENGRRELINFCLSNPKEQYLAIGWSCVYPVSCHLDSFNNFIDAVRKWTKENKKRTDTSINLFKEAEENDLFWTRDLYGYYWICRAKGSAISYCDEHLDIGALLPIEAYKYQSEVPGQIKAAFNRVNGGVAQRIYDDVIINYSKFIFNECSHSDTYEVSARKTGDIICNLPDFELEELVISYIQIQKNYYVLSNSIANRSTTIAIECEFMLRDKNIHQKAVVQVKGEKGSIDVSQYKEFLKNGCIVFLFSMHYINKEENPNIIYITREELLEFYSEYKHALPESITKWEDLFSH